MIAYGSVLWFLYVLLLLFFLQLILFNYTYETSTKMESLNPCVPISQFQQLSDSSSFTHITNPSTTSFLTFAYISSLTFSIWIPKSSFSTQSYHYCTKKLNNSLNIIKYLISDRITPIILQMNFTGCSNQHRYKPGPPHRVSLTPRSFYVYLGVSPFFFIASHYLKKLPCYVFKVPVP